MSQQPLSTLNVNVIEPSANRGMRFLDGFGLFVFWLIILSVAIWLIIYSLKPSWVIQSNGQIDTAKVLWTAILIALAVIVLYWLIRACIVNAGNYRMM